MSEEQELNEESNEMPDELTLLKERADLMGIKYSPNIGVEKLKERIAEKVEGKKEEVEVSKAVSDKVSKEAKAKMARKEEALKLVRVRITNMNPLKGVLKGEIISAGNSEFGFVKKFIPFNAENGWHIPQIILNVLKDKKFMTHYEVKVGNKRIKRHKLIPEYSIEILPPLTPKELEELKQRQLMASGQ